MIQKSVLEYHIRSSWNVYNSFNVVFGWVTVVVYSFKVYNVKYFFILRFSRKNYLYYSQREQEQKNAEDVLFDMFRNEDSGLIPIGKFLAVSITKNWLHIYRLYINPAQVRLIWIFNFAPLCRHSEQLVSAWMILESVKWWIT